MGSPGLYKHPQQLNPDAMPLVGLSPDMGFNEKVPKMISEEHKPKIMSFKRKKGSIFHNSSSKNHIINIQKAQEEFPEFSKLTELNLRNPDVNENQNNYHQEEFDINSEDLMY